MPCTRRRTAFWSTAGGGHGCVGDAAWALEAWSGAADTWFLDGFSPALNPGMWSPEVLDGVAARSAPGARLATFTVAGAVRRGLAERGFQVGVAILEVNNTKVATAEEFEAAIASVKQRGRETALIKFQRDSDTGFVGLPLGDNG